MTAPEGWKFIKLGEKANIFRGGSPRPIQAYLTTLSNGINWIKIGDVEPNAKFINTTNEKIIPEGTRWSREVKKGDFILSNSMSFCRSYILNVDGCIHDGWLVIQDYQNDFDQHYLYYALCSDSIIAQYKSMAAGSSVQNLSKEKVAAVVLLKPPLPEQQAIAEVLSDIDGYLASLEKLIAKKNVIKQGTMQELLTGKRRLPGFEGGVG
jgi:type I restriction enzyme S subunit